MCLIKYRTISGILQVKTSLKLFSFSLSLSLVYPVLFFSPRQFRTILAVVWIPRGKQLDLPTITPSERATGMCAACNAGDAGFRGALRIAECNGRRRGRRHEPCSRMANPYVRVRDFISWLVYLRRESDIQHRSRAHYKDPKANYTDRCRLHTDANANGNLAATEMHAESFFATFDANLTFKRYYILSNQNIRTI